MRLRRERDINMITGGINHIERRDEYFNVFYMYHKEIVNKFILFLFCF